MGKHLNTERKQNSSSRSCTTHEHIYKQTKWHSKNIGLCQATLKCVFSSKYGDMKACTPPKLRALFHLHGVTIRTSIICKVSNIFFNYSLVYCSTVFNAYCIVNDVRLCPFLRFTSTGSECERPTDKDLLRLVS
jgi:hypothetical protein